MPGNNEIKRARNKEMPIGMTKPRKQREDQIIRATFDAISSAMGWDRKYPRVELQQAVRARLNWSADRVRIIMESDAELERKMQKSEEYREQ